MDLRRKVKQSLLDCGILLIAALCMFAYTL